MSDTSSLYTLPESLRESLYTIKGTRRYQTLSEEYPWPCDTTAAKLELLTVKIAEYLHPNGLWSEPEGKEEGELERVFERSRAEGGGGAVRVLDLGSGMTAAWCLSMAERFPGVEVIGVDLIPCDLSFLPPNLTIEIHDLLEGLPFPDEYFDLIHFRDGGIVTFMDSPQIDLVSEMARALKPGGVFLSEIMHNRLDPFYSSTAPDSAVPNPFLEVLRQRHRTQVARVGGRLDAGEEAEAQLGLAERVRSHDAFRGSTSVSQVELPLGVDDTEDATSTSLASLVREATSLMLECYDAGAGVDETVIREMKSVEKVMMPERYDMRIWVFGSDLRGIDVLIILEGASLERFES